MGTGHSKAHLPEPMVRAWPSPAASVWVSLFNALEGVNQMQVLQTAFVSRPALPAPSLELVHDVCVRYDLFGCHSGFKVERDDNFNRELSSSRKAEY